MAKVSNFTTRIDGKIDKWDVHYNKTNSFHIKGFPQTVLSFSDNNYLITSGHSTEASLIRSVNDAIEIYHKATKQSRKVITYTLQATSAVVMNRVRQGSHSGYKKWVPGNLGSDFRAGGHGFAIDYEILLEVKLNGTKYYHIHEDTGEITSETHVDKEQIVIDWTEQREQSLIALTVAIENMVKKAASILCDEKKAINLLDSGVKLLS